MDLPIRIVCAGLALIAAKAAHAVTGSILPAAPIAEPTELGTAFNFDILVRNDEPAPLVLEEARVELRPRHARGRPARAVPRLRARAGRGARARAARLRRER